MTFRTSLVLPLVGLLIVLSAIGAPAAIARSRLPAFAGCLGYSLGTRPRDILFACGDGGFDVNNLRWSSWTARSAAAVGVGHQNDCNPYCAAGHYHAYADLSIRLSRPEICTRGRRLFTRITYRFLGHKPEQERRQSTLTAPFLYHSGCP